MTSKEIYLDKSIWIVVFCGAFLVASFSFLGLKIATIAAVILICAVVIFLRTRPARVFCFLMLAACYERPVLDFGIGIRGTIKLVDLVIVALFIFASLNFSNKKIFPLQADKKVRYCLTALLIIALGSVASVVLVGNYPNEAKIKATYYFVVFFEYIAAFFLLQKIRINQLEVEAYSAIFLFGLVLVAVVAILQGLGLVENTYYTSVDNIDTNIADDWAISTLGPNHSHLGSYMALGFVLAATFLHLKFRIKYLLMIPFFITAIGFAHSAVGIAMVGLHVIVITLTGNKRIKPIGIFLIIVSSVFFAIYLGGSTGVPTERTVDKFDVSGADSELVVRSVLLPVDMLSYGYRSAPWAVPFGFGFRVPDYTVQGLKPTGDNNYFSVIMDLGVVGLSIFTLFVISMYKKLSSAKRFSPSKSSRIFNYHLSIWFVVVAVSMFFQEIIWPLHSRGSTMLIFLMIFQMGISSSIVAKRENLLQGERR